MITFGFPHVLEIAIFSLVAVPLVKISHFNTTCETRGPRGPWVAHLRKRSKVTVKPIIENPEGII